ncbi:MAG TPA: tail fiber domain-containing protein [Acetobacteraceae bacterium]|nr:tail fiber domain-containing protein [Acetobacteraceae bacterium]
MINTRSGAVINYGDMYALNALPNAYSTIQHISIVKSGFDQIFQLDGNALVATLPSATPVAGGSGCNVNDRFYDAYNNTYTATAVTAGAVTAIALNAATARFGGVPANPVTLSPAPGFSGTGVQVNLTWVAPTRFVIRAAGGSQSMLLSAAGGITAGNPITLPADPTTALQAATKQYVDGFLRLSGGTMTGALTLAADPVSAMQAVTKQYVDLHAAGLTDAPVDGFGYGRLNAAWAQVLPLTGGQLSGNLAVGRPFPALINTTTQCGVVTGQVVAGSFTYNAYVDTAGAWRYRNANTALFFGSFGGLTGIAAAVAGAADALVTWGPAFQVDARGNVGLNMTPPAGQAVAGSSGGWIFAWGITAGNYVCNLYFDGAAWRYQTAAAGNVFQAVPGGWTWSSAPSGAVGAVASLTQVMALTPAGNLTVNGSLTTVGNFYTASINATGAITAGSDILGATGVYAARATASNFVLYGSSAYLYHQYENGWYWAWNRSSGNLVWVGNGGTTFATFDSGGGLTLAGGLSVAANTNISGNMVVSGYINTQNYIMNASGIFYVANNTNYYLARNASDGAWRFVEGGTINMTLDTGGGLSTRGSVAAAGGLSCMSGSFWIGPGGTGRVINIASQWYWDWNGGNGDLWWQTASGAFIGFAISSALLVNNLGPVGGSGAYQDYSDARGKQNIADAEHGLAEILQLRPVTFTRIPRSAGPEPKPDLGFVAQEVQGVLPEAVHVMGLVLPDGSGGRDSADPTLGVSTTPIVAAMVNAIKELAARVQMLEAA